MNDFTIFFLLIISAVMAALGSSLFKYSSKKKDLILKIMEKSAFLKKMFFLNKYVFAGMLLYIFSALLFVFLLKYKPLNVLYPVASINYMISAVIGFTYFKEKATKYKITGIVLVVAGIILVFA